MKNFAIILLFNLLATSVWAQLSNGSVAPNWTLVDINGNSHTLYDYLDNGKTVYIDFSATWCSTCWNYHQTHALEDLYQMFGPDGTDQVMVFFIEGEANSNTNCLTDTNGCNNNTQGDWTEGVSHPIIDDASINGLYEINGFPTIYGICSDRIVTRLGRDDVEELTEFLVDDCIGEVDFQDADVTDESCFGAADGEIDIDVDGGPEPFTFLWSNGATTEDIENLAQGTYTCTITNSTGTTAVTESITVNGPADGLVVELNAVQDVTCNNSQGAIQISVSGGATPYDYDWSNGASSQDLDNIPAGNYSITVTDDDGCDQVISNIEVTQPAMPSVSVQVSAQLTCDPAGVSISGAVNNEGNNPAYEWSTSNGNIVSGGNSLVVTVDAPGMYTLLVSNTDNGCTVMTSAVVTEVPALNVGVSSQMDNDCNGDSNGSISASVSGGNMPYVYMWSNGATGSNNTNLTAGNYKLTVTDTDGCTETLEVDIEEPTVLAVSVNNQSDVLCFNESNGSASLNVSGGVGSYSYNWSDGGSGNSRGNLSAGTFIITVTDGNACTEMISVMVEQPMALTSNVTTVGESALNANDGSASVAPMGGTSPYSFAWSSGSSMATVNDLAAGNYTVTVTDANDCSSIGSGVVSDFDCAISANIVGENVLCNGEASGSATAQIAGGNAPFTYEWSNSGSTQMINDLIAGTYTLTVTDNNGCPTVASISIMEPMMLAGGISSSDETSFNANDGTASVEGMGGTAPYSYSWSNGSTMSMINNLSPDTYAVTITDSNNCTTIRNTNVDAFDCTISSTIAGQDVLCNGEASGSAMTQISGGNAPFTYQWSNGGTTPMISSLVAGTYDLTLADNNNCQIFSSVSISEPTLLTSNVSSTNETGANANDGTASAEGMGGTAPYAYLWSNGGMMPTISNLTPGTYEVTVTDANNCSSIGSVATSAFDCTLSTTITGENLACNGFSTGTAMVETTGGATPFTYIWSNGATEAMINDLAAGSYTVTVTDANDCPTINTIMISEPSAITFTVNTITNDMDANGSGAIDVEVEGGTGPFVIEWSVDGTVVSMDEDPSGLMAGDYTCLITDSNDCTFTSEVVTVDNLTNLTEQNLEQKIRLFPNPTKGNVHIHMNFEEAYEVEMSLLNVTGKQLLGTLNQQSSIHHLELNLADYPKGLYFVKMRVGESVITKKIIVR